MAYSKQDIANRPPDPGDGRGAHWDSSYRRSGFSGVSWFQAKPLVSLELIAETGIVRGAPVVDVGGGASGLVDRLINDGFQDVSVLDVSQVAIDEAIRRNRGERSAHWLVEDVLTWSPARHYTLWHDRAVFHFLVSAEDKEKYARVLSAALSPGGFVVIGTFAADGPVSCSGLAVARYSETELIDAMGGEFSLIASRRELHLTPSGGVQPFTWVVLRHAG